eukprot:scaffold8070_cov117-Cylindrotheca_fusiformis.AAC.5
MRIRTISSHETSNCGTILKTQSIPVSRNPLEIKKQREEERRAEIAELQEQMFQKRILNGMKERKRGQQQSDRIEQQSQSPIDSFAFTRHPVLVSPTRCWSGDDYFVEFESAKGVNVVAEDQGDGDRREDDDLIFQLDL